MVALSSFPDPLKIVEEILVVAAVAFFLGFLYQYRHNVMLALTGDTHVHFSFLDTVWWLARCGGTCTGDWTRGLTSHCCCLPKDYRGVNLVRATGRLLGLASRTLEIRNIVVGDLPSLSRGDFYLTVQCASNPDQVTSVAEDQDPKVVHFPEILTLRLRNSPLEERLMISVRELSIVGFNVLCEVQLNAMNCLDWSADGDLKRFAMKPTPEVVGALELETPPWIVLEFSRPTEDRHLEEMRGMTDVVRTVDATGTVHNDSVVQFKGNYQLIDPNGLVVDEPSEDDLQYIRNLQRRLVCFLGLFNAIVFTVIGLFSMFRVYLWSCYDQMTTLTLAVLHNRSFPMSVKHLRDLAKDCAAEVEGTGLPEGLPCRPSKEQVYNTCHNLPPRQPMPLAGKFLIHDTFGVEHVGLTCDVAKVASESNLLNATHLTGLVKTFAPRWDTDSQVSFGVCEIRDAVQPYDPIIYLSCVLLMLSTVCCRLSGKYAIRRQRSALLSKRAAELKLLVARTHAGRGRVR